MRYTCFPFMLSSNIAELAVHVQYKWLTYMENLKCHDKRVCSLPSLNYFSMSWQLS